MTLSRSFLAKTFLNSVVLCNSELLAANSALCGNVRLEVFESSTVRPFLAAVCLQRALIRLGDAGGRDAVRLHCKERARSSAPDVFRRLLLCVFQHAIVRGCAALSWCWARADDPVGCRHACFPRYYTTLDTLASQLVRRGPQATYGTSLTRGRYAVIDHNRVTSLNPPDHCSIRQACSTDAGCNSERCVARRLALAMLAAHKVCAVQQLPGCALRQTRRHS